MTLEIIEQRLAALEKIEADRRAAMQEAAALREAQRAQMLAAMEQARIQEAADRKERIEARKAAAKAPAKPVSIRIGGMARSALIGEGGTLIVADEVTISATGKWIVVRGHVEPLTALAEMVHRDGGEAGRRAAKTIYAGLGLPAPAWLAPSA